MSHIEMEYAKTLKQVSQLERELAEVKEQLRLCNVDQFTTAAELADAVAKEREQEPVGQLQEAAYGRGQILWFKKPADTSMLYTAPPRREWVPLTDDEITEIRLKMFDAVATNYEAYRAIEAKLKEKNGG